MIIKKYLIFILLILNLGSSVISIQTTTSTSGLTSGSSTSGTPSPSPTLTPTPNKACSTNFPAVVNKGYNSIQVNILQCSFTNKYQNSVESCTHFASIQLDKGLPYLLNNDTNNNLYFTGNEICSIYNQSTYYTETKTTEFSCITECLNLNEPLATGFIKDYVTKDFDQYNNVWTNWSGFTFNFTNPDSTPTKKPIFPCNRLAPLHKDQGPEYMKVNYFSCNEDSNNVTTCNDDYDSVTLVKGIPIYMGNILNYTSEFTLFYNGEMVCVLFLHFDYYCKDSFIHNSDYCTNTCVYINDNSTQIVNYNSIQDYCNKEFEINYYHFNISNTTVPPSNMNSYSYSYSYSVEYSSSSNNSSIYNINLNINILLVLLLNLIILKTIK